ncbi:hypothetical protein [Methanosarcina mazei]|jgi:hypothetical protein|uniref:hypothetical protein n=1 Tax=Methanosarcina mazei TaxID=2209 RepID=UPI000B049E02|nr:hypothetical protein [Methanosarcina mazei]
MILSEIDVYNKLKHLDIITPTQVIYLGEKTPDGRDFYGLVRPRLKTSIEAFQALTDS